MTPKDAAGPDIEPIPAARIHIGIIRGMGIHHSLDKQGVVAAGGRDREVAARRHLLVRVALRHPIAQ